MSKAPAIDAVVKLLVARDPQLKRSDEALHDLDQTNNYKVGAFFPIGDQESSKVRDWTDLVEPTIQQR